MNIGKSLASGQVRVVVAASSPAPDIYAAKELADHLSAISGKRISIYHTIFQKQSCQRGTHTTVHLLVGTETITQASPASLRELAEDEIEIFNIDSHKLAIRGNGTSGTLYAVYELLERLGVRWFHPDETFIPTKVTCNLPASICVLPGFEYREAHWYTACCDTAFAGRMRYNGSHTKIPASQGGHWGWDPYVHSFFKIIPPEKYGSTHPDYYSLRKGQGRVITGGQLCLSNPDVIDLLTEFALRKMANPRVRIVDLSQMDHANPCECPACSSQVRKTGAPAGSILAMCNTVAERTSRLYPHKNIATLAYTYSEKPPRNIQAHPNVIVRLCHMDGCETHPLDACARNRRFLKHLREWTKIAGRVYIWDYVTNFQHLLYFHPNFSALSRDIRIFRDLGIRGLFLQGYASSRGVAFSELHAYAMGRCMWNPDRDYCNETQEFLSGYYGPAGPHLWQMLRSLQENVSRNFHLHLYRHPHLDTFAPEQLRDAKSHLDKAYATVRDNHKLTTRLDQVALWMNFSRMASAGSLKKRQSYFHIHTTNPDAPALYQATLQGMKAFKVKNICEFPASLNSLKPAWAWSLRDQTLPLFTLENDLTHTEICPALNGMVCTLLDKKKNIDLFCKPHPDIMGYPYMGGMIEGIDLKDRGLGFHMFDRWHMIVADAKHVVMQLNPGHGLRIEREIKLLTDATGIRVRSTITNRSPRKMMIQPHAFVFLRAGELADIHFFKHIAGNTITNLRNGMRSGANMEQWVNLSGREAPHKYWGFFNPRQRIGLSEVVSRTLQFSGSNGYLNTRHFLMESQCKPICLHPGASTVCTRIYRILHKQPH